MTRHCGALAPSTGAPCTQLVGDLEDHCAAGHPCPPATTGVPAGARSGGASSAAGVDAIDDLVEGTLRHRVREDAERGDRRRRMLKAIEDLPEGKGLRVDYLGTVRGEQRHFYNATFTVQLDRFLLEGAPDAPPMVIARGRLVNAGQRWYAEVECKHPGCQNPAYRKIPGDDRWYGAERKRSASGRMRALKESLRCVQGGGWCDAHLDEAPPIPVYYGPPAESPERGVA